MITRITRFRLIAVCLLPAALCAATPARAGRALVVARGIGLGSDKAAAMVEQFAHDFVRADARYTPADLAGALGSDDAAAAKAAFDLAAEMVTKGRRAYESLELDPAVEYLNTALSRYEQHGAYLDDPKRIIDVLLLLGATHILRGDERLGGERLAAALAIDPQVQPDPSLFNPSMRAVFQEAAARLASQPRGAVSITSTPSYGQVALDGRFVGVTPVTVGELAPGRHYLRVSKAGYRSWGSSVEPLAGGQELSRNAALRATPRLDEYESLADSALQRLGTAGASARFNEAIKELASIAQAAHVLLLAVRVDDERVTVDAYQFDVASASLQQYAQQRFSFDSRPDTYRREIGALLLGHFGPDTLPPPPGARLGDASGPSGDGDGDGGAADIGMHAGRARCFGVSCATMKAWGVVVGAGMGMVLAGTGGGMWAMAKRDNDAYRHSVQNSTRADELHDAGRRKALVGDILVSAGAAALVGALVTYLWWDPAPSEQEAFGGLGTRVQLMAGPTAGGGGVVVTAAVEYE